MMSQLKPIAKIDVNDVKQQLRIEDLSGILVETAHINSKPYGPSESPPETALSNGLMSLSPSGEILVIAHQKSLLILSAKWDAQGENDIKTRYIVTWKGDPCHSPSEQITAVVCLPLILPGNTSRSARSPELCSVDWTCIAVGFSSGFLRFYDEGGGLLLSEQIHLDPILYLKCQSYHPSRTSSHEDFPEELYVTFPNIVATIPGFALFQTLRACRNQLARVQANCSSIVSHPPLALKKWAFKDQDKLRDCEVIGPSSSDMFDHLLTASMCGGFSANYRAGAPKSTLVVGAGRGPFVGFHFALEGVETRSVLTDVALAVTSKFKGWLLGNTKGSIDSTKESVAAEAAESMACRFGVCDSCREASGIVRSPNREYSAVTDTLGRVILINNSRGIVVRMWKGYRKAQCGWLQVEEEEPSTKGQTKQFLRTVLFLVIYDPKKGLLEIWPSHGPRVAAFSCGKTGRLLYTSHGLVGLNNIPVKWANKSLSPCVFVDCNGVISEVLVPFHCALSDSTSERAADLSLLRKLRTLLREKELDGENLAQEVGLIAAELKTADIRNQMLMLLVSHKNVIPDALEAALAVFMDRIASAGGDTHRAEDTERSLLLTCQQLRNLIGFYKFIQQQREKPPDYSLVVPHGVPDIQALCISSQEWNLLNSLSSFIGSSISTNCTPRREARVTFKEGASKRSAFVDFLSCFNFGKELSGKAIPNAVSTRQGLPTSKTHMLADLIFQGILFSNETVEPWQAEAACSGIVPLNLLQLAMYFWLNRKVGKVMEMEMLRFFDIIKAVCLLEEVHNNDISGLWEVVRCMLKDSCIPFNAMTAAFICRGVAVSLDTSKSRKHKLSKAKSANLMKNEHLKKDAGDANIIEDEMEVGTGSGLCNTLGLAAGEWEDLSWDSAQWNFLIGRLEDIALLDAVLSHNPGDMFEEEDSTALPRLPYEKPKISLGSILSKGKGSVSELVAKWLTSSGLDPKLLIEASDIESAEKRAKPKTNGKSVLINEPPPEDKSEEYIQEGVPLQTEQGTEANSLVDRHAKVLDDLRMLRNRFPYSLSGSVLLANLSWELILKWHRSPSLLSIYAGAISSLQSIPCIHVRQGLCCLMWSSHIKQRFEIAIRIINESAGNPKEKLCRKELEMSEAQLLEFLSLCLSFLNLFIEASNMSEVIHFPGPDSVVNCCEDLWDYEGHANGAPSLTKLALMQPQANFDKLCLLLQLTQVTEMILSLNLRGQQLQPLFSSLEWSAFFSDISHSLHVDSHFESRVTNSRNQFLLRAVSGAWQNILTASPSYVNDMSEGPRADMKAAMQWMGRCQELAYTWQINMDPLRRHQVCLLYSAGHDRLAEEIVPAVNEADVLASQLLLIAGQRVKLLFEHSSDLAEKISNLDPALTSWLFELNTEGVRSVCLSDTALLATHAVQHLPENHPENHFATELYDALQALLAHAEDD